MVSSRVAYESLVFGNLIAPPPTESLLFVKDIIFLFYPYTKIQNMLNINFLTTVTITFTIPPGLTQKDLPSQL